MNEPQTDLRKVLAKLTAKMPKFREQRISEAATKAALIEPVLRGLGWDVSDPDEVCFEFKVTKADKPVDYALRLMRGPRLFIEAKPLGENLSDPSWVSQALGYAVVAGVEWCVLTDGDGYHFYNALAPIHAREKLFCSVRLSTDPESEVLRVLQLISRENLQEKNLEQLWKAHFIDRRVKDALKEVIVNADSKLVSLLKSQAKGLKTKEVVEALRRLEVQISTAPALQPKPSASAADRKKPKSKSELIDLISRGVLVPPLTLFKLYKKQRLEATLQKDGIIEFNGNRYNSPSAAALAALNAVSSKPMKAAAGWDFWSYTDRFGKVVPLQNAKSATKQ